MYAKLKHQYDTLTSRPERGPEFYLARHLRKRVDKPKGGGKQRIQVVIGAAPSGDHQPGG